MFEARPTNRINDTEFFCLRQNPCLELLSGSHEIASGRIANSRNRYGIDTSPDDGERPLPRTYGPPRGEKRGSSAKDRPLIGSERPPSANPPGSRVHKTYRRVFWCDSRPMVGPGFVVPEIRVRSSSVTPKYLSVLRLREPWRASGGRKSHAPYSRLDLGRGPPDKPGGGLAEAVYGIDEINQNRRIVR